ncbi:expressed unknown protein [Seminavis robusta]|uniref:Uncharacterized protein n=1 Tax=Seminavis robusta TaxID=568900 RepID=A0A9N8DIX4_9STRA|nr:expressed unknown protein [Seminavis robusta]|eukprot:Sro177_g077780.1 n/a (1540) ;mRNA; f:50440-55138
MAFRGSTYYCVVILILWVSSTCESCHGTAAFWKRNQLPRKIVSYGGTVNRLWWWKQTRSAKLDLTKYYLECRGGSDFSDCSSSDEEEEEGEYSESSEEEEEDLLEETEPAESVPPEIMESEQKPDPETKQLENDNTLLPDHTTNNNNLESRIWHTSDMLQNLVARSAVKSPESVSHRELITKRANDYLDDLMTKRREQQQVNNNSNNGKQQQQPPKLPHPKKVLHYLAPKIPAIKHSPDVNLKIVTARSDIDSGVAACLIGTLARVCEVYDRQVLLQNRKLVVVSESSKQQHNSKAPSVSASVDLVKDRRFEQVVECLLCGVDVKKRKRENLTHFLDAKKKRQEEDDVVEQDIVEDIIEGSGEQVTVREGLSIRDACRAAWGLAILGAHHRERLGGTKVTDLLMALSLRIRELLLSRLQMFLQGDLMEDLIIKNTDDANWKPPSPEQRVDEMAEELAEDSAAAMWAFACVRACTGMRSAPLFETCCAILCQDPVDMRKRAQAKNEDASVNDLLSRLAHSEAKILLEEETNNSTQSQSETPKSTGKTTTVSENKDALIDWLSPNELTDVLWALALHGHSDGSVREDTVLSENAGTLKDIAFDRLMVFLRKDCALVALRNEQRKQDEQRKQAEESRVETEINLNLSTEEVVTNEGETVTVQVVDAAALLASEKAALVAAADSAGAPPSMNVDNDDEVAAAYEAIVSQSSQELAVKAKETASAPQDVLLAEDTIEAGGLNDDGTTGNGNSEESTAAVTDRLYFSAHDLCSLAWAVTELRDSLRFQIVDLVINIFLGLGEESFDDLSGADLSNLAWACARHTNDARPWSSEKENPGCLQLGIWVVRRALIASGGHDGGHDLAQPIHMLDPFQPPELSRLMWAVASLVATFADRNDHFPDIEDLAMHALISAGSNLSMFSPEDLVRIFWAFLEVCDMDETLSQPGVADALGKVFSTIESSIIRWERGHLSQKVEDDAEEDTRGGFDRLTSLFLRPSLSQKMLDELIEEYNDIEEEEGKVVTMLADGKKRLPRLRDLGIDPATLTKAAGSFARLTVSHSNMRGSPILTRVTLKLLTSKNGRLLQEFSMCNLIRACEAAAINEAVGRGEDLVVGQFARRFLQLLNEANDASEGATDSKATSDLKLSSASPEEIATLLWSLGELGARHFVSDKDKQSAYRKLRLVVESPLLTDDQIQCFSTTSALQALRGLVTLNAMRSDKLSLLKVLKLIEPQLPSIRNERDLCEVAESLAAIRRVLAMEDPPLSHEDEALNVTKNVEDDETVDLNATVTENVNVTDDCNETDHSKNATMTVTPSDSELLQETSSRMLSTVARYAAERVTNLRAGSLCRLLVVYSLLPFQADDFINACELEVARRQALLEEASSASSVEDLLRQAAQLAVAANATLLGLKTYGEDDADGSSPVAALKKGIMSLFSSSSSSPDEDEDSKQEMASNEAIVQRFTNEVGSLFQRVTAVDTCMEQIGIASNVHTDTALQKIMEGANFELGRCHELIDNYRRIEFSTGRRKSRYDYDRDIGKRLLSRLIPR